jgi:hypothetical protein
VSTSRSAAGAAAAIVVALGFVVFIVKVVAPERIGSQAVLERHLDDLETPESWDNVAQWEGGTHRALTVENPTIVRVYSSPDDPSVVCDQLETVLAPWGLAPAEPGPLAPPDPGCGYAGRIGGTDERFQVQVVPPGLYTGWGSGAVSWDGPTGPIPETVVEVEVGT